MGKGKGEMMVVEEKGAIESPTIPDREYILLLAKQNQTTRPTQRRVPCVSDASLFSSHQNSPLSVTRGVKG